MQKITTFLTFDGRAEEAMNFYVSIFKDSKIVSMERMGGNGAGAKSTVLAGSFRLDGQEFMAMDAPGFPIAMGVSLFVHCTSQAEVDELWKKLSEGGAKGRCGWLTDKFGVSWQIIPGALGELIGAAQGAKKMAVIDAMLKMDKIDIKALEQAGR